jgi:Family of unknown function (DUF5724)/Domain of unknown function (DUF4132)
VRHGFGGAPAAATAARIVAALDDLAEAHRNTRVTATSWQGRQEVLLADALFLPSPWYRPPETDGDPHQLLLPDVFAAWWRQRPADLRTSGRPGGLDDGLDGGLDALRALTAVGLGEEAHGWRPPPAPESWWDEQPRPPRGAVAPPRNLRVVVHVLSWLLDGSATGAVIDECLDAVETALAAVPAALVRASCTDPAPPGADAWRHRVRGHPWHGVLDGLFDTHRELFDAARIGRWFRLLRWLDEPGPEARRAPVDRRLVLAAHAAGAATDADLLDQLLQRRSGLLAELTRHRRRGQQERHPRAAALADRARDRVLELERGRGELPTPASELAVELSSITGAAIALGLLGRLGRTALVRGSSGGDVGRESVFSRLLRVSHPGPDDTPASCRAAADAARLGDGRLVELAVFAPQWAALVEGTLGWPGLADGVWWFHAHTKDDQWAVPAEVRETWAALSGERTPLSAEDLVAGAVDVEWFHRCQAALGERWASLHAAAKLASHGSGHTRAQLFADAMLGRIDDAALLARITGKRHQDAVRALGLLPLPADPAQRSATTRSRYQVLREFERGSAKFGSQRRASERAAVRIGIENLARSTGLPDPQRFVWAMEADEAGDLADGPVTVAEAGVTVTLSVGADGVPELAASRGDRALRSIPAGVRKAPAVAALTERRTALSRQLTRVRGVLEAAMVAQDPFTADDLTALDRHPLLAPMLRLLVFVDDSGQTLRRVAPGRLLDAADAPVTPSGPLRLAHPVDLLASGSWVAWQQRFFADELRQPFRQVFRELYPLTDAERSAGPASHRYDGHQIQPGQAMALLNRRGWLADREAGEVSRAFHRHDLVARIEFLDGFLTPAEVELPTLSGVHFTRRGEYLTQPIHAIPPVVFSETMRDLDLVVSVAHAGGVDPEATASTVEMRAALARETARLMRLDNIRFLEPHVVIAGVLGEYSVHLGSGTVHRRPGGALCIIPVDSQRRGRVFLPFADDDPKTAEIIAKILLLARDSQLKDPTILDQLRS